ncbi:MAG: aldose 1-epimerase, partial [SAR324 cluster bacterium]
MAIMLNENEVKEKKLTLRSRNALLEIVPEIGGSITRYCLKTEKQTLNFLRPVIQSGLAKHDPREMASFPLIPFSNRIRNGHFKFQGREIKLPLNFYPEVHSIHGHGWKVPWTVKEKSENKATIEYQLLPDEWPFSYLASQVFDLEASSLTVTLQIKNTGNSAMPVGMGLHPYFVRTPQASITAKTEKMWINDAETMPL